MVKKDKDEIIANLRREITIMREALEKKNKALAAALYCVWCSGDCRGGVHYYDGKGPDEITEELVQVAERNTKRLCMWFENHKHKQKARG